MIDKIIEIINETKPGHDVTSDTQLVESGLLDSFDVLLVVSELESQFEVSIPGELLVPENFDTPSSIAEMINNL